MDNNAFRTLVNQQLKSTKEIAREAVESEFRQKKQKRGGGGGRRSRVEYDSDSASDDDDLKRRREGDKKSGEEVTDEPEWKRRRKEKAAAGTGGQQWRDRAKERREGKNLDYNDAVTTATIHSSSNGGGGDEYTDKKRQAELSKFLGGDEEHTHLVKGLDLALAQKVRREEMGAAGGADGREEDLDQLLEDAYNTQQKESVEKSKQSSSIAMVQPKSELGKSVQHYLLKKQQEQQQRHNNHSAASTTQQQSIQINPTKQNSIQRSHYTFSLDSTIQKRHDAWDVPQLQMIGGGGSSGQQEQSLFEKRGMTPLDCHLIATIKKKLDGALNKGGGGGGKRKEMNDGGVERIGYIDNVKQLHQQEVHGKEQSHQEDNVITEKTLISNLTNSKKDDSDDDDSDDDIFADVGTYIPPTAVATTDDTAAPAATATATDETNNDAATTPTAALKKQSSIFDNLITDQSNNNTEKRQPMQLQQTQHQHQNTQLNNDQSKNVIDRDVFGGSRKPDEQQLQQVTKRRGPQTAALEGVSMTNYEGGYGEEMDTDFLNEDGDGYQKKKRWDDDNNDDGGKDDEDNVDADDDEED
mmetsp:Transcript_14034/g.21042  ORF Transcript_14034/g.21042 Transcript_14034/m.21042 type:complete len:582 (+) Transcript_14034:84-1829(+)